MDRRTIAMREPCPRPPRLEGGSGRTAVLPSLPRVPAVHRSENAGCSLRDASCGALELVPEDCCARERRCGRGAPRSDRRCASPSRTASMPMRARTTASARSGCGNWERVDAPSQRRRAKAESVIAKPHGPSQGETAAWTTVPPTPNPRSRHRRRHERYRRRRLAVSKGGTAREVSTPRAMDCLAAAPTASGSVPRRGLYRTSAATGSLQSVSPDLPTTRNRNAQVESRGNPATRVLDCSVDRRECHVWPPSALHAQ